MLYPTLRAIPFPEVTESFCRLPSTTFLYRLEASNLGDLMRLLVRTRLQTMLYRDFSRTVVSTPDPPRRRGLFQHDNHFTWQADFMDFVAVTKKREHFPGITTVWSRCMCCYHWCLRLGEGYLTRFSFACSSVMPPYGDLSQC